MAIPKKKIRVNTNKNLIGSDRVKEILNQTDTNSTFLPRTIGLKDIDSSSFSFIKDGDIKLNLEGYDHLKGKQVPVVFLTNERWGEFSKTWVYTDDDKNLPTPYITVRRVTTEKGTHSGDRYNVPQLRKFVYLDVPSLDKDELVMTRYKIPQPITINVPYEIRFFTKYMRDLNSFVEKFYKAFSSMQAYILVNGHYLPVFLDSESDEDTMEDINGDRFYVKVFQIVVRGYIQNQEDFEVTKTVRKKIININFIEDEIQRIERIQEKGTFEPPPITEVFPIYYGSVPNLIASNMNTFNANLFLFKLEEGKGDKTLYFNATNERIVFMYDSDYGELNEIIDIAGDDILPAFDLNKYTVNLEFTDNQKEYLVYYNNFNVTVSNYKLIFKF
ncbi:MAG: hypothetical protein ACOC33_00010 [bacterium]